MEILLDTHAFLWFVSGNSELSQNAINAILDPSNKPYLSIASLWEISIKTSIGKLQILGGYDSIIDDVTNNGIEILPITFVHTSEQNKLPFHHRDPFDRIIVSQAIIENMDLVSIDAIFDRFL